MRIVTILRKPLEGTVAQNTLHHGCGGLNIDGARISTDGETVQSSASGIAGYRGGKDVYQKGEGRVPRPTGHGRFPANLILQHLPTCEQTGTQTVPGYAINRFDDGAKPFGGGAGHTYTTEQKPEEQVVVWTCSEGCPVGDLGEQSGERSVSGSAKNGRRSVSTSDGNRNTYSKGLGAQGQLHNDTGTAARFFKQVKP